MEIEKKRVWVGKSNCCSLAASKEGPGRGGWGSWEWGEPQSRRCRCTSLGNLRPGLNGEDDIYFKKIKLADEMNCKRKKLQAENMVRRKM